MIKTSETTDEIFKALHSFQSVASPVPQTKQGHGYKYAPLDAVVESIQTLANELGLAYLQMPVAATGESVGLTTRIFHTSGEWVEATAEMPIPKLAKGNMAQWYGAALTYLRRYTLSAGFGLVTEEDTDGGNPRAKTLASAILYVEIVELADRLEIDKAEIAKGVSKGRTDNLTQITEREGKLALKTLKKKKVNG